MDVKKKKRFEIPKNFSIKKLKKDQLLILLLVGILLVVIAIPTGKGKDAASKDARSDRRQRGEERRHMAITLLIWKGTLRACCHRWPGSGT